MPEVIYKYTLEVTDVQTIMTPADAKFLTAINQREKIVVYARVDPKKPLKETRFHIYGTGNPIPDNADYYDHYLGTVPLINNQLVFHVYLAESYDDLPF